LTGTPIKATFVKFGQIFQNWTEVLVEFKLGYELKTCPEERRRMKLSYTFRTAGLVLAVLKVGIIFLKSLISIVSTFFSEKYF
jgi:hypothetical protein